MATQPPKVSVIIPCFNHGEFLPEAIASVLSANRPDVEMIVVDDGSTDERTRTEMNKLASNGIHVIRQENKGLAAARNAAIAAARGEYIFPLDADDHMRPECLDREIPLLSNPNVGVVYSDGEFFGTRSGRWNIGAFSTERLLHWNFIPCCALYRRQIWEQNSGYDGSMPVQGLEDWDLWLGALEHGWEFHYVPEILFEYRVATESMITRSYGSEDAIRDFVTRKHGQLYRKAWLEASKDRDSLKATLVAERESVKFTSRNLGRLLKARLRQKLNVSRQD